MIERLSKAMGAALVGIDSATTSRQFHRNFISHENKSDLLLPEIYKALKPC